MNWLLVACGGALGASLRYLVSLLLTKTPGLFPWGTWTVNLVGCFLAGVFFAATQKYPLLQQEARLLLMVGVLGGFTTFSSFGLETFQLLRQGYGGIALLYSLSSLMIGIMMLAAGFYLLQFLFSTR